MSVAKLVLAEQDNSFLSPNQGMECEACSNKLFFRSFFNEQWKVLECSACGTAYVLPHQEISSQAVLDPILNPSDRRPRGIARSYIFFKTYLDRWRFRRLLTHNPVRRALVVGLNRDYRVAAIKSLDIEAFGIDSDPAILERARRRFPDYVFHRQALEDTHPEIFGFDQPCFDLIIVGRSIQRTERLDDFMIALSSLTLPGGRVIIEIPSLCRRGRPASIGLWPDFWPEIDRRYFNLHSLRCLLTRYGLTPQTHSSQGKMLRIAAVTGGVTVS